MEFAQGWLAQPRASQQGLLVSATMARRWTWSMVTTRVPTGRSAAQAGRWASSEPSGWAKCK
eukprot:7159200-Alexandrium_andersonii.AAC.1